MHPKSCSKSYRSYEVPCFANLCKETDPGCQRNAFVMLMNCDKGIARQYFLSLGDRLSQLDPTLQLAIIQFIRSDPLHHKTNLPHNIQSIVSLLQAPSTIVKFEAASALMLLSTSPTAVKAVANCYIELAVRETDNNAKLMVLNRFAELQSKNASTVNESITNVVRVLAASDMNVRCKALEIILSGVTARHASEVVSFLVKELAKTTNKDHAIKYRQCLLSAIDSCATRFPQVAPLSLSCFIEVIQDSESSTIHDAIRYSKY